MSTSHTLTAEGLSLAYDQRQVVDDLTLSITPGRVTTIVGPNACGKSTLLRGLSRLLAPTSGAVLLDGVAISARPTREVARVLGLLPQTATAPEGITVADLVARGRFPHQGWLRRWSSDDESAVATALTATDTHSIADREVDELSGGQRQRVWIAMALAQQTDILLLDEPTTFLDLAHQIEVLDLLTELNATRGTTVVLVLHDLNLAARYSDVLVAMQAGRVVAAGPPGEVVTEALVRTVFGLDSRVLPDPVTGTPLVVPIGRHRTAARAIPTAASAEVPVESAADSAAGVPA
ncbi:ABC transporter ATP-binding protein [uncultured Friedmanniella sp.]|uniref:ABC transporter ATP-binding protein n=1 Tax=uncultured Friedmanniella sp. TaxID=335381 RepID=UPI0035CB49FB